MDNPHAAAVAAGDWQLVARSTTTATPAEAPPDRVSRIVTRWRLLLAVLVVGAIVFTACGDDDSPADAPALTVEQLVARSADTSIAVQGFLIDQQGVTRLCAAILESYPPQCGEPAVELVGLDLAKLAGRQTDQGITWKEWLVLTVQRRQDARFDVLSVESE